MERIAVTTEQTLIAALAAAMPQAKKKTLKDRIANGAAQVNGTTTRKATHPLRAGDTVTFGTAAPSRKTRLPVIFEDESLYVVDKPEGMLSVAGGGQRIKTAHAIASADAGGALDVVHRLDRETSGVLVFAKSEEDRRAITQAWKGGEKTYFAVVEGAPPQESGTIYLPLWEHPTSLQVHVVPSIEDKDGARDATTHYDTHQSVGGVTLLRVRLQTGRKHQIRAHLAHLGCPIIGDERYGTKSPFGLLLHAAALSIDHPRKAERVTVQAPMPARLRKAVAGTGAGKSRR